MRSFPWDSLIIGKNEEYNYPIIDRPSSAEDLRELYKTFFTNGVFLNEENAFQVTPGDGMNVIVAGGKCGIEGTIGYEAAPRGLAIQASSSTADRIDTVVLRWNNNIEVRSIDMYVKTGVAQDVPVRPTLTRSESVWELGIADVFVAKNSGAISSARITDTRLQTDRCGAVAPFMEVDTTGFFDQLQAQTQIAVDLAQSAIDGTTAGNLQSQIDANSALDDERWASYPQIQYGSAKYTIPAGVDRYGDTTVTFDVPFDEPPLILLTPILNSAYISKYGNLSFFIMSASTTGFSFRAMLPGNFPESMTSNVSWLAIAPREAQS